MTFKLLRAILSISSRLEETMQYYIILIAGQILVGLAHFSHKTFAKRSGGFLPIGLLYAGLISLCSLPVFSVLAGFDLSLDGSLLFYSAAYGILAAVSQMLIFLAFGRVNMVVYSVFSKSSAILVCITGFLFFGDAVTVGSVLSVVLLTAAILIPLFEIRSKEGKKNGLYSLIICLLIMLDGFIIQLVVKGFTELDGSTVEAASALYFYANIVMAVILLAAFYFITRRRKAAEVTLSPDDMHVGISAAVKRVPSRIYVLIPITATVANIPCVTSAYCLMNMDLSIFTIITKAAESLVFFCISRFFFKEKTTRLEIIALILSTLAGMVTVL